MKKLCLKGLLGLGVLLSALLPVQAADLQWTGSISQDLLNARNWSPQLVPSALDNVTITGAIASIANTLEVQSLTLSNGATLIGAGNIKVNGNFLMESSTLSGTGTFTLGPQAVGTIKLTGLSPQNTIDRVFYNGGVLNWNDGKINESKDFYNQAGATVNVNTDAIMQAPGLEKPVFYNAGKFIKNNTPNQTTIAIYFSNSGEIILRSGRLNVGPRFIRPLA